MTKEKKQEEAPKVEKKQPKTVNVKTNRGLMWKDGWLPAGTYEFSKYEATNLIKKGFGIKVTK